MLNYLELSHILNGSPIALLNARNGKYLSFNASNNSFDVTGIHPYLLNKEFEKELKTKTEFHMVLSSMPNYTANTPRSSMQYGTQISFMTDDQMFLVATRDGGLTLESLKGDQSLISTNLPANSKFTFIDPYNAGLYSKPLLFNDQVVLRSSFGGYLGLDMDSDDQQRQIGPEKAISNGMIIAEEVMWRIVKADIPYTPDWVFKRKHLHYNMNSYFYNLQQHVKVDQERDESGNLKIGASRKMTYVENKNKPKLMEMSTSEQDTCLVKDLLLTMLGMEGNYIKRITSYTNITDFKIEFQIEPYLENPTCDPPLLSIVNLLLPLSYYYDSITHYLNITLNHETGLISKAFAYGIKKLLREYVLFVNQLDEQMRYGEQSLNLQQLWWLCQPCLKLLENLHKLCQKCMMIKGGALINVIYHSYLHETDSQMKKMYKFLLDKSFIPCFDMLKNWVCHGILETEHEYGEFMVFSHKDYSRENLKDNYLDLFWDMKFRLNSIHVPEFLSRSAEKILFIGKSLNIIRECGRFIQCPFEMEFESFSTKNENLGQGRIVQEPIRPQYDNTGNDQMNYDNSFIRNSNQNPMMNVPQNNMSYLNASNAMVPGMNQSIQQRNFNPNNQSVNQYNMNNSMFTNNNNQMIFENERLIQFEKLIDRIYEWANGLLKNILFQDQNVESLIKSFKRFYLLECGDFYNFLIDSAHDLFFIEKNKLNFEKLQVQIENAIRSTNANLDENKDKFYFDITNTAIIMEKNYLDKYISILNDKENSEDIQKISEQLNTLNQTKADMAIEQLSSWEVLVLHSKISWPLNLIFSRKNILKYELLFRQLIKLKFVERALNEVWMTQQFFKEYDNLDGFLKPGYMLSHNMLSFVRNITSYFFGDVIETSYIQMKNSLTQSYSLEELMKNHDIFLDKCMDGCLIENQDILGDLNNVLQCCVVYTRLALRYYNSSFTSQKDLEHQRPFVYSGKNPYQLKKLKKKYHRDSIEAVFNKSNSKFTEVVKKFSDGFDSRIKLFLQQIKALNEK
ncbi:MAG: hypothetical protein MJ252_13220 [archaeon]|nr:hypothetical protein [archaeon]